MDLFLLRDVIRPLYWADNSSDFRVNGRPPFLQAKSHTCDLINLSHSNSALAVLLPGVKSAAIVSPSMAKLFVMQRSNCFLNMMSLTMATRSEEHTSELQSRFDLVCRLLLEKKKLY